MKWAECFGLSCSQSVSFLLSGVSVSHQDSTSETPSFGPYSGAPVPSKPAELTFPHSAYFCVRPGLGSVFVLRMVQSLHAAVGVVASRGMLGDPDAECFSVHHTETPKCGLWTSYCPEGEAAALGCPGGGVGGEPGFLCPCTGIQHSC